MSSLNQIRDAFKARIQSALPDIQVYDNVPDVAQVPAVVVMPDGCDYIIGGGNCQNWQFCLYVLVPRQDSITSQELLDSYLSSSGANSIPAIIKGYPSLGLSDVDVTLRRMSGYGGSWDVERIPHIGACLHVDVLVTM